MISGKERWQQSLPKTSPDLDATTSKPERIWKSSFLNTVSAILQSMMVMIPTSNLRWILPRSETSSMKCTPKTLPEKIKSALRTRKKSGKYISSGAPFGYQKDPADHNHLVIDPNTAPVVEYIYSMAEEGLGLHRIAKRLHDEKVLKPCYYKKEMFGRFIDDEKMYDWDSAYISQVLHSQSTPDTSSTKPSPPCP